MAGSDGNRGYLVQAIIALLDSLRIPEWDRVTIEPSHESTKVDILWESRSYRRAAQVKSSIRQISEPDVQRWAQELANTTAADRLDLVLVGSASLAVTKLNRIGNVSVPRPRNLDWDSLINEGSHLLDVFLHSIGLATESPSHTRLLVKGLISEFSNLASESKVLSRTEFVGMLTLWIETISPEKTRAIHESVLSKLPRSLRPTLGTKLIGRDQELRWLHETEGDKLIVGQPGIGKTFLLREFVREETAVFLRSDDEDKVRAAVCAMSPAAIVVEDSHIHTEVVSFLRRLRAEQGLSFAIVADCWPGSRDLMIERLGLRSAGCLELERVSNQAIVDIVLDCGIKPSNSFLHMVVAQAGGFPGRAAMLVAACLGGTSDDYREFWNGETLARMVRVSLSDLVGRQAIQVLACFATGGAAGVSVVAVARALELPRAAVVEIVTGLALGGVVTDLPSGRIAVVPSPVRAVLVRDHFFGGAAIPLSGFLQDYFAFSETVKTLVEACALGAQFSAHELRVLVRQADSLATWRALVYSSKENAEYVLAHEPELISDLARAFLQVVPELAIPELLRLADGDNRPLHSHPNHPLRQISDWTKSGYPNQQALTRRRQVCDVFQRLARNGENVDLALRLLPVVVSPEYVNTEQNPGNRLEYTLRSGCVAAADLQGISEIWGEILETLTRTEWSDWRPVLEAAKVWLWPHFGGSAIVGEEQRQVINSSATEILTSLTARAADRPGVLRDLARIAAFHEVEIHYTIHPTFDALFPVEPSYEGDYQSRVQELAERARSLGKSFAEKEPVDVIREMSHWIAESAIRKRSWPDMCPECCAAISAEVEEQLPWVRVMIDLDARADLLVFFLGRAITCNETGWEAMLNECIGIERYRRVVFELALTAPGLPSDIIDKAIRDASKERDALRTIVMLRELDDQIIFRLLESDDATVISATLEGIWHKLKKAPKNSPWYDQWREATARHLDDDFCLRGSLAGDPELSFAWSMHLASGSPRRRYLEQSTIDLAVGALSDEQKAHLMTNIETNAKHASHLLRALVGGSTETYATLLRNTNLETLCAVPLQRTPDKVWMTFASMALQSGIDEQTILDHTRSEFSGVGPIPGKYHNEIDAWTSCRETAEGTILRIVDAGIREAEQELQAWETGRELES